MENERRTESDQPAARIHRGYLVGNFATGWYFPGELTQRPRLAELKDDGAYLDEDELTLAIEEGLAQNS